MADKDKVIKRHNFQGKQARACFARNVGRQRGFVNALVDSQWISEIAQCFLAEHDDHANLYSELADHVYFKPEGVPSFEPIPLQSQKTSLQLEAIDQIEEKSEDSSSSNSDSSSSSKCLKTEPLEARSLLEEQLPHKCQTVQKQVPRRRQSVKLETSKLLLFKKNPVPVSTFSKV